MFCTAHRSPAHLVPMLAMLLVTLVLAPVWVPDGLPAAHAAPTTWTVTTLSDDSIPAACIGGSCATLRDALAAAQNGDTINLVGLNGVITTTSTLTVTTNLTITGPGASVLAVSGAGTHTVLVVNAGVTASISGVTIEDGSATTADLVGDTSLGGGIYNAGDLSLANVVISANSASGLGGGIYSDGSAGGSATLALTASTVVSNTAPYGGGIYSNGANSGRATLSVTSSTIANNTATQQGGGIVSLGAYGYAALSLVASTVSGNAGGGQGGGIASDGEIYGTALLTLTASTVADNVAGAGAGIYSNGTTSGTVIVTATNTLLAGSSTSGGECSLISTTLADQGGNLADDTTCGFSALTSISGASTPGLGTLGNYGGPTSTIPLLSGSQARGLGVPAGCAANSGLDQRGVPRLAAGCDSGAFEATAVVVPLLPATLPLGTVDSAYTQAFTPTDGVTPITFTSSLVPPAPGLNLVAGSGVLSGTPTLAGSYPFTVTTVDGVGEQGSRPYTLTVQRAPTSLSLTAPTLVNLGQSIPVTATLTAPLSPTAPTGTVVFTLTSNLGTTSVGAGTLVGTQATATLAGLPGASSYTLVGGYSGDGNFLPSSTGLGAGRITQLGCAVQGSLLDPGVGSLSFSQIQVPPIGPGQVLGSVDGVLTVNHPVLAACLTGGTGRSATITGAAGGSSRLFPPGTSLTVYLALAAGGQEVATITGGNGQVVILAGSTGTSRFGLVIRTS